MTDLEKKTETKDLILDAASELFSKFGFTGASVRDIATASGANVAAINYHFGNKHNLYWAVVQKSHACLDQGMLEISQRVNTIEDMIVETYEFLMQDPDFVRTTLKIMLTAGVPEPEGELKEAMDCALGPPGTQHIIKVLRHDLGKNVSDEMMFFAVNAIFGNLLHWAMLGSCCKIEVLKKRKPELRPEAVKEALRLHVRAICEFIQKAQ